MSAQPDFNDQSAQSRAMFPQLEIPETLAAGPGPGNTAAGGGSLPWPSPPNRGPRPEPGLHARDQRLPRPRRRWLRVPEEGQAHNRCPRRNANGFPGDRLHHQAGHGRTQNRGADRGKIGVAGQPGLNVCCWLGTDLDSHAE